MSKRTKRPAGGIPPLHAEERVIGDGERSGVVFAMATADGTIVGSACSLAAARLFAAAPAMFAMLTRIAERYNEVNPKWPDRPGVRPTLAVTLTEDDLKAAYEAHRAAINGGPDEQG